MQKRERDSESTLDLSAKDLNDPKKNAHIGVISLGLQDWPHRIEVKGSHAETYGSFIICSPESVDILKGYSWCWSKKGYVYTHGSKTTRMARLLLGTPDDLVADHKEGYLWDHRLQSLRNLTIAQNSENKSKTAGLYSSDFYGVAFEKATGKYTARVGHNGVSRRLGNYLTEKEAAIVYDTYVAQNRKTLNLCHKLNYPENESHYTSLPLVKLKERKKSKTGYVGVYESGGNFQTRVKGVHLGCFVSASKAAKARDDYIVENGFDVALNIPERHPNYVAPAKIKMVMHYIDLSDDDCVEKLTDIGVDITSVDVDVDFLAQIGGKNRDKYTIIEKADYDLVKSSTLHLKEGYVIADSKQHGQGFLSRLLFPNIEDTLIVDHLKSITRDNRRRCLKPKTRAGNNRNAKKRAKVCSSSFIGVSKTRSSWSVKVMCDNVILICRAGYLNDIDAARDRDLFVESKYSGEYRLNFDDWGNSNVKNHWLTKSVMYNKVAQH